MRNATESPSIPHRKTDAPAPRAHRHAASLRLPAFLLLGVLMLWSVPFAVAQTRVQPRPALPAHKALHARSHARGAHRKAAAPKAATTAPAPPPAPIRPNWPANNLPTPAMIVWDSRGLSIKANNSSLQQILIEVQTVTGAKVQGLESDERVFGEFGPGLARDVLSQLLQGSDYNVIMIGDMGKGAPRSILLSPCTPAGAAPQGAPAVSNNDSAETGDEEPPQPPAVHDTARFGFVPGGVPRSPQQIAQDLMQHQQQNPNPPPR